MTLTLMYLFVEDVNSRVRGTYEFHKKWATMKSIIPQYKLSSFKKEYEMFKVYKWKTIDENRKPLIAICHPSDNISWKER